MELKAKLAALGTHYRVKGFEKLSFNEKVSAIKKASGKELISDAYDAVFPPAKTQSETVTAVEKPKGPVQIIPPTTTSHSVDVSAPVFNVNVPAPTVTVQHGDLTWSHLARQSWLWINGALMGGLTIALFFMARGGL